MFKSAHFARRTAAAVSAVALMTFGTTSVATADTPSSGTGNCAPVQVLQAPGTTETDVNADPSDPKGLLKQVQDNVMSSAADNVNFLYVPYPADFGHRGDGSFGESWDAGVENMSNMMEDISDSCPDSNFIITGFSQGALVAGDVASNIGNGDGPIDPDRLISAGLFADALRGENDNFAGKALKGHGAMADGRENGFGKVADRTVQFCDELDMFCNADVPEEVRPILDDVIQVVDFYDPVASFERVNQIVNSKLPEIQTAFTNPVVVTETITAVHDFFVSLESEAHVNYTHDLVDRKTDDTSVSWMAEIISQAANAGGDVKDIDTPAAPGSQTGPTPGEGLNEDISTSEVSSLVGNSAFAQGAAQAAGVDTSQIQGLLDALGGTANADPAQLQGLANQFLAAIPK